MLTMETKMKQEAKDHLNPYLAGFLLGLTLLASFLVLGAGLGASGGLARVAAWAEGAVAPQHTLGSEYFGAWGEGPLNYYLVFMLAGVFLGGLVSAMHTGRLRIGMEKGPSAPTRLRAIYAAGGGLLAGLASRLAQGCTSGQALTGGALLLSGSLLFLIFAFAGGYAFAYFVRRQWND
jgi:hypothetical protein